MEGAPTNPIEKRNIEAKKASKLLTKAAALVGMATAAVSPISKVGVPVQEPNKIEIKAPPARPEDIDEGVFKEKITYIVKGAQTEGEKLPGQRV